MSLVSTMIRQHDAIAEKLNGFHLQVISLADSSLPGLVVGDTPVVHAALEDGRYGFRDRLALGDATFIIGPLTRTTAACFSARPLRPGLIKDQEEGRCHQCHLPESSIERGRLPSTRRTRGATGAFATRPAAPVDSHHRVTLAPRSVGPAPRDWARR